jgi:hypothetical protein
MSGGHQASAGIAGGGGLNFSVVTAAVPGGFGWSSGDGGSISPSTLKGQNVTIVETVTGVRNLLITINAASLPQNFFTRVLVANNAGTFVSFNSSAASYTAGGVNCIWAFGDGSSPVWTSAGITRAVIFYL